MDPLAVADGFDEYDCLFCKRVASCPYGKAFVEHAPFSPLHDACFEHDCCESEAPVSDTVRMRRFECYGADPWDDVDPGERN